MASRMCVTSLMSLRKSGGNIVENHSWPKPDRERDPRAQDSGTIKRQLNETQFCTRTPYSLSLETWLLLTVRSGSADRRQIGQIGRSGRSGSDHDISRSVSD